LSAFTRLKFSFWYFFNPPWDTGITPPELYRFIDENPAGTAIDLGCGTGTNAVTLAEQGWRVVGIDFARPAIEKARARAAQASVRVDFIRGDVTRIDDSLTSFDLVLDIGCLHGLAESARIRYLANLDRLVARGGTYLLYANLKAAGEGGGYGITQQILDRLAGDFSLVSRCDGMNRGLWPSAWLQYKKQ
jgi:SAM-dependent methyltransferase